MKRKVDIAKILFIITMVLMFLPMLQQFTGLINFKPLKGVTNEVPEPVLSLENYRDGKFQSQAEKYMSNNFGFRQPFIRLYNQYIWSFYHKTNVFSVVIGKDDWLYERYFVEDHNGTRALKYTENPEEMKELLRKNAIRIRKLQGILEEYGKHLFILIEPGKDRTYPEYLPEGCTAAPDSLVIAADFFPSMLDSLGVNYMNVDKLFEKIKDSVDYNLFTQTGTHWSNIASAHAADSMIRFMEHLGNINMKNLIIGEPYIDKVKIPDDDLEQMMNLMFRMYKVPIKYADISIDNDTTTVKPRMTLIGDSFFWNLANGLPVNDIFENYHYWYYNSTIYFDPRYNNTSQVDIVEQMLNTDFIVLAACTSQLYDLDWKFSRQAIMHLCYDQSHLDNTMNGIVAQMINSPEWKAALQEKADQQGCTLEEMALADANYLLYKNPENYLDELNEEHPSLRNTLLTVMSNQDDPRSSVIRSMLSNPKWMDEIRQKSAERGQQVSETMLSEAQWVVNQRNEQTGVSPESSSIQ